LAFFINKKKLGKEGVKVGLRVLEVIILERDIPLE
jgi:hypothetical protein